jgi:hypothetical protein
MRFGTRKVRSILRSGSFTTVARELAKYKLDLVGVQEVSWDKGGTVRAGDFTFIYEKERRIQQFCCTHSIVSAVKRAEFLGDTMSYRVLRGRWCNFIVLNVHAPIEKKSYDTKDGLCEELKQVFDHFLTYHMNFFYIF